MDRYKNANRTPGSSTRAFISDPNQSTKKHFSRVYNKQQKLHTYGEITMSRRKHAAKSGLPKKGLLWRTLALFLIIVLVVSAIAIFATPGGQDDNLFDDNLFAEITIQRGQLVGHAMPPRPATSGYRFSHWVVSAGRDTFQFYAASLQ